MQIIVIITKFATNTKNVFIPMLENTTYDTEQLTEMLQKHGVRPSAQRIAVLYNVASSKAHPSAEEIYLRLSKTFHSLSRTTVYNSLHTLVECGLLRQLEIESDCLRYDFAVRPAHSHFICRECGRIIDMPMPEGVDRSMTPGYSVDTVDVFFRGLCPECGKQ